MKKKEFQSIDEEDEDKEQEKEKEKDKKVNNFVGQGKRIQSSKAKKQNIAQNIETVKRERSQEIPRKEINIEPKYSEKIIKADSEKEKPKNFTPNQPRKISTPSKKQPEPKNTPNRFEAPKPERKPIAARKPTIPKGPKKSEKNGKKKYSDVYEGPDRNLVEQLERELSECPSISFDDIAQLQTAKNLLQEAVLLPRLMPQFFQGIRKAMKGILLFGPPGTGKTLLAKAIAKDNIFLNVSASSLASKWKG